MIISTKNLTYELQPGNISPLGATPDAEGVNFSIFSENATGIELLIFDNHDDLEPVQVIPLDPVTNHTFSFWHIYVKGIKPGYHYAYRVDGPNNPDEGHRFNKRKVLVDPYSKGTTNDLWNRKDACHSKDNLYTSMRSTIIDTKGYNWTNVTPPNLPLEKSIIYELHVGQFTKSPTSKVSHPGTFLGLIEKIPYLKELGVTAVELMPICSFDNKEVVHTLSNGTKLYNTWGYNTVSYFAPHSAYCVSPHIGQHLNEFRDMVKAFHQAGIEVIMDVVYNHTSEGNHNGPTIHFKGLDNRTYYHLVNSNKRYYMDYSGCGNSLNANHPVVQKFVLESLQYWVSECQIDGFRFDEGSIFSRGEDGSRVKYPPLLWNIDLSSIFAKTKLIAEAWDAAGLFEVGTFPGYRWAQWNGYFRDEIRQFIKGTPGLVGAVAKRIAGSADFYQASRQSPLNSLNFVTCHDGFTMMDLVSYDHKHNQQNGENNQDGINNNHSWNCGHEGATEDVGINQTRKKIIKNGLALLLLSRGVPMINMGDEIGRSQNGNNNAYCQDNETFWFNWELTKTNQDILEFTKQMIALRRNCSALQSQEFYQGKINERGLRDIDWHGCKLYQPGWYDASSNVLSFTIASFEAKEPDLHVVCNMHHKENTFEIPSILNRQWFFYASTDATPLDTKTPITQTAITIPPRTIYILTSK